MEGRILMKRVAKFVHGICLLLVCTFASHADKPNIILIMADDLGYGSLGCYGNKEVKTPHIDRLASEGLRFTDFHSNGAYCSPTRAALMTGRYQQRCAWVPDGELSPVFRNQRKANHKQRWAWGISPKEITLPSLLQQSGYHSALIGKWHLGYEVKFHPMQFGFQEFRGFMGGNVDYHSHIAGYGLKQLDWWIDRKIENQQGYTTDVLTRNATEFIKRQKDQPFFLYLAHGAPHDPWQGRDPASNEKPVSLYKEMIEVLDELVGKITEALRNQQLENQTLLIFCSDNGPAAPKGFAANATLRGQKGSLYEGGHRVPCIARWPGVIPASKTHCGTEMTMDFLPTFAAIAGARIPESHQIDGRNMMPSLLGKTEAPPRTLHWHSNGNWAVRGGPWKLMGDHDNPTFLANLDTHIQEKTNFIATQPEITKQLLKQHMKWIAEVGEK
jgi:arylsulfatase A